MNKKMVIANLKMNKTIRETKEYVTELFALTTNTCVAIGVCPPATAINSAKRKLSGSKIMLGAQNIHEKDKGAYTGEISAEMAKEAGAEFSLIGHSERRKYYNDTNNIVNSKVLNALKNGLTSVLCIGETLAERGQEKTDIVLKTQVSEALNGVYGNELKNIIIAYEPVWAIGTKKIPSFKEIEGAAKSIREILAQLYGKEISAGMTILYGGSVDESNSKDIAKIKGIDGFLVGGASLDIKRFVAIINSF